MTSIDWIDREVTPPPIDKKILTWCQDDLQLRESKAVIAWYGHNSSEYPPEYTTGDVRVIEYDEDGDPALYQVDEDTWRTTEWYEDRYTNEYYYAPVAFKYYAVINPPHTGDV